MIDRRMAVWLVLSTACGCAPVRATLQQPSQAPAIAREPTFHVQPLRFAVAPAEEEPEKWARHVRAWTQAYWDGVRDYADSTLGGRNVQLVGPGQAISDGIVVEASVSAIRRSKAGVLGTDHLEGDVVFVDARTGERLLSAKVDANSDRFGPEGWTFGGRIKFCSLNLAKGVVEAMRKGRFPQ